MTMLDFTNEQKDEVYKRRGKSLWRSVHIKWHIFPFLYFPFFPSIN
jgi:hypothetical protein